ncbi:MAG TPA: hypothetical protein VGQ96_01075, partial [Candidatus Eremiobacteraceae bacterium]|nr:hypothetical protein [Candidatus Eremiobacteraceae bacterium]
MALSVIATAVFVLEVASWHATGSVGGRLHLSGSCAVQFIAPSPEEARGGIRPGDTVDLRKARWLFRADILPQTVAPIIFSGAVGDTVAIPVARRDRPIVFVERLQQRDSFAKFISEVGYKVFFLLVGAFVLFRGRDTVSFILGLWCMAISFSLPSAWFGLLSPSGRVGFAIAAAVSWQAAPMLLYFIIEAVVRGLIPPRIVRLTRVVVLILLAPLFLDVTVNMFARIQSGCGLWAIGGIYPPIQIVNQLIILAFFVAAYGRARGMQRQRIRWVFWAFLISRIGVLIFLLNLALAPPKPLPGAELISWVSVMLFPLGTGYAVLRHRIIDVSFVLNRALLYTVFTTLTVGFFVLLENLLNNVAVNRGISLAVEILVALGIGLSFHLLRERLHSHINRLLFRRKHNTTVALNRFVEEAPLIESADTLVARASNEISKGMATDDVRFYQVNGDGYHRLDKATSSAPEDVVAADDPAFSKLRHTQSYVDLGHVSSALGPVGYAFPLSVRGENFGALVCGRRVDDETYAPDERDLLRHVAREVAAELFMIRSREESKVREEAASDVRQLRELEDENRRLKQLLAERKP